MPEKPEKKNEMSDGAKYALIGTIFTAVVGLIGTALTLYFNYLEKIEPQKLALEATQTAEARLSGTAGAVTPTATFTLTFSPTSEPTQTASPINILPSPTVTLTLQPTSAASGVKYCVDTASLNVRSGPGLDYPVVGGLNMDTCIYFDGRLEDLENKWVRISPGQEGYQALGGRWVYGVFLRPQDFERLPVVTPPPPVSPTPTPAG
jgi:hypothetical protein